MPHRKLRNWLIVFVLGGIAGGVFAALLLAQWVLESMPR